jgi:hypothetical protein
VKDIHLAEDVNLANQSNFPLVVAPTGGGAFDGMIQSFAATMPIELWLMSQAPAGAATLAWFGGSGPFVVQSAAAPIGPWNDAPLNDLRTSTVYPDPNARFFRIQGDSGMFSGVLDSMFLTAFCSGDGSTATPCPCGNTGLAGWGCDNSNNTGGAHLSGSGAPNPDTLVLTSTGELPSVISIFLQGSASLANGAVFGDGVRCVGGNLKRLHIKSASAGTVSAPSIGDPTISAQSSNLGDPIAPGSTRFYQVYYRDPNAAFCAAPLGSTFNVSNAVAITWGS